MHNKLLEKHIRKHFGDGGVIPDGLLPFVKEVSDAYDYYEKDKNLLERSSDLSSKEMLHLNGQLRREADEVRKTHAEVNRILDNINEAFFSMDMVRSCYVFVSSACEKVYGYTKEDFMANPMLWREVIHPDDSYMIEAHDAKLQLGESITEEYRIIHPDRSIRWVCVKIIPSHEGGHIVRIDIVVRDVTEQKQAQLQLEEANLELSRLFNNIDEVIYSVDTIHSKVTHMSSACEKVYGYSPEAFYADVDLWGKVTHPDDVDLTMAHYPVLMAGGHVVDQCRIITQSGELRWVEYNMVPTLNADGMLVRIDGITRDITEQKLSEEKLEKAHQELNNIFNSIGEVLYSMDLVAFRFLQISPACDRIFGYPPSAFYSDPALWRDLIHPDDAFFIAQNQSILEAGEIVTSQYRIRHKDLSWRWIQSTVTPTLDREGRLIRIDGVATDITDKKIAEQLLLKSEANLRAVFNNTDTAYLLIDPDLLLVDFNHTAQVFAQRDLYHTLVTGSYTLQYFLEHRRPILEAMMRKTLQGETIHYDISYVQPDESMIWYYVKMMAVTQPDGTIIGLTMSLTDISDSRNTEVRINALNESLEAKVKDRTAQLEASNKELEAFSYSVSHDLRAPLRIINGYAQTIIDDSAERLSGEDMENLKVILATTDQMSGLIDDLLDFSRLGRAAIYKRDVNMNSMVRSVIEEYKAAGACPAVIIHDLPDTGCDPNLTRQVWVNLISNAIKYSGKSPQPRVEIGTLIADGARAYYVKDNGAGFDMKYADKLFGVFQRLHDAGDFEGTGVGLALSHRIITRQGGRIWAEAKVNEGATFYFTLPEAINQP